MALGQLASLSSLKLALIGITGLGLVFGGAFAAGIVGTPEVVGVDNSFGDVNESTTVIESDLKLHNPNPVGVTLGGLTVDYEVRMNDITMATGGREGVSLERGNSSLSFESEMDNRKIPDWWVSHLQNGENTTLEVHTDVRSSRLDRTFEAPAVERAINTSLVEAFNSEEDRELDADQAVIDDPVLVVRETRGEWGDVDEERTEIEMEFDVYNPRAHPVTVTDLGYEIRMNGVEMGDGETGDTYVIPPGEEQTIEATTRMNNRNLDEWWVSHLQNDQVTDLEVDFYMRVDLSDGGGSAVTIPLDTMEQTVETDIFDEKGSDADTESNGGNGTDDTDGTNDTTESDGGTDDDAGDDGTQTETPSETEMPTPTPTPDSDGGDDEDDGVLPTIDADPRFETVG